MQKMLEPPEPPGYRRAAMPRVRKIDWVLPILHRWLEGGRSAPNSNDTPTSGFLKDCVTSTGSMLG